MKKTIAKVVKHLKPVKSHHKPVVHEAQAIEPEVIALGPPDVAAAQEVVDTALAEASDILLKLSQTAPALLGTSHGAALVLRAKLWIQAYTEAP